MLLTPKNQSNPKSCPKFLLFIKSKKKSLQPYVAKSINSPITVVMK